MTDRAFQAEVAAGQRFRFGTNWQRFLAVLDDSRISEAELSLRRMLGVESLGGKRFIDVGSGSGLFSLAAIRLGASQVHSFDFDPGSVACTEYLKRQFVPEGSNWTVEIGSVLDTQYLSQLGTWDVVYSWGVLHHTGAMYSALRSVASLVAPDGTLFIAIYNNQGWVSRLWTRVKRAYNRSRYAKWIIVAIFVPYFVLRGIAVDLLLRRVSPLKRYRDYQHARGMSALYDMFDWLGGYPFETAQPDEIFALYHDLGFSLDRLTTIGRGHGCNQYVFRKL